jgi:thioredoxin 1
MNKVIKFSAAWCGPCKTMKPIYEKFAEAVSGNGIDVIDLDVDANSEEAMEYGVRSIPLTVFVKDGKVVDKISGVASTDALLLKYKEVYQN